MLTRLRRPRARATLEIWEPRWHDRKVLIAVYKVANENVIKITKGAAKGKYKMSGIAVRSYPKETNGRIPCYAVPLDKLTKIGDL